MTKNPGIKPEFKMAIRPIWNYQRKLEHTDLYWSQLAAVETTPFRLLNDVLFHQASRVRSSSFDRW